MFFSSLKCDVIRRLFSIDCNLDDLANPEFKLYKKVNKGIFFHLFHMTLRKKKCHLCRSVSQTKTKL